MDDKTKRLSFATGFCFFFYFAQSVARYLFSTLSPEIKDYYGLSISQMSFFVSAENLGFILIMLISTFIGDRFDKSKLLVVLSGLYGIFLLIMGSYPSLSLMLMLYFITGMLGRYMDTSCTAYISDLYGNDRAKIMSWLLVFFYIGQTLAPNMNTFILEVLHLGWNVSYLVSAALLLLGCLLFFIVLRTIGFPDYAVRRTESGSSQSKLSFKELMSNHNMLILFFGNIFLSISIYFNNQLMLYLSEKNPLVYDTVTRGLIATAGSLGLVVGSGLYIFISRKMSAHRYLAMEMVVSLGFNIIAMIFDTPVIWMASRFLLYSIGGGSFTAKTLLCCEEYPNNSSSAISVVYMASGIALLFASPMLGYLADLISFDFSMWVSLFFSLISWVMIRFFFKPHSPKA